MFINNLMCGWKGVKEGRNTEQLSVFLLVLASLNTLVLVRGWSDAYFIYKLSNVVWKDSFFLFVTQYVFHYSIRSRS